MLETLEVTLDTKYLQKTSYRLTNTYSHLDLETSENEEKVNKICELNKVVGDDICDDNANVFECKFDGGDCCWGFKGACLKCDCYSKLWFHFDILQYMFYPLFHFQSQVIAPQLCLLQQHLRWRTIMNAMNVLNGECFICTYLDSIIINFWWQSTVRIIF